jgi:NADPH:quinone reductase
MKAILVTAFGGPDVLSYADVADPTPGPGEMLIRVRASGVNPVDTYVRSGAYGAFAGKPPFIAGTELAGEVVEGPREGERVYAAQTAGLRNTGAHAELAVVKHAWTIPEHLSFEEAAAIPVAYGTAYRALVDRGGMKAGDVVLIHGASGGVGQAATQVARALGATVIGTASTDAGKAAATDAGANHVFDHSQPGYLEQVRTASARGIDLVIEMLANVNLDHDLDLLSPGGRVVIVGSRGRVEIDPRKTMGKETDIRGMTLWGGGDDGLDRAFKAVNDLFASRRLWPAVAQTFKLADAALAQKRVMESGSTGKLVLVHA